VSFASKWANAYFLKDRLNKSEESTARNAGASTTTPSDHTLRSAIDHRPRGLADINPRATYTLRYTKSSNATRDRALQMDQTSTFRI
jgi:hypothetical protein